MRTATAVRIAGLTAGVAGVGALAYGVYVANTWCQYGRNRMPAPEEHDPLLDRFMPGYDVTERHHVYVRAPPAVTLAAAAGMALEQSRLVRAIFAARAWILGAPVGDAARPRALVEQMQELGWRVLSQTDREIVVGAVTQPWMARVRFRGLAPDEFIAFDEPDFVRIAWTLRVEAAGANGSIFRTETRVATTDGSARRKFRWYWARFSPGIVMIRYALLWNLKKAAEWRARSIRSGADEDRRRSDFKATPGPVVTR
jgi:hypothetical protein